MNIVTQIIPVTLLNAGDYYYPVVQATGEVMKDEGMHYVVKASRIDKRTGAIYAIIDNGVRVDWQNGATVAREVPDTERYAAVSRVGTGPVPPVR
jgi:hypothetical protein